MQLAALGLLVLAPLYADHISSRVTVTAGPVPVFLRVDVATFPMSEFWESFDVEGEDFYATEETPFTIDPLNVPKGAFVESSTISIFGDRWGLVDDKSKTTVVPVQEMCGESPCQFSRLIILQRAFRLVRYNGEESFGSALEPLGFQYTPGNPIKGTIQSFYSLEFADPGASGAFNSHSVITIEGNFRDEITAQVGIEFTPAASVPEPSSAILVGAALLMARIAAGRFATRNRRSPIGNSQPASSL